MKLPLTSLTREIFDWMKRTETDPLIASMIERYLRARGERTLADIASDDLPLDHKVYVEWHDESLGGTTLLKADYSGISWSFNVTTSS